MLLAGILSTASMAIIPGLDDTTEEFAAVGKIMITDGGGYTFQRGTAFAISDRHAVTARHVVAIDPNSPDGPLFAEAAISFVHCGDDQTPVVPERVYEPPVLQYFYQSRQVVVILFPEGTFAKWYEPYYPEDPVGIFTTMVGTGWNGYVRTNGTGLGPNVGTEGTVRYGTNYVSRITPDGQSPQWNRDFVEIDLDAPESSFETQYECMVAPKDSGGPCLTMIGGQWRAFGAHEGGGNGNWGTISTAIRLSRYQDWIETLLNSDGSVSNSLDFGPTGHLRTRMCAVFAIQRGLNTF